MLLRRLLLILLLAACAPAAPPTVLSVTPGASVIVTRSTYRSDQFSLSYPQGWRVITSPAGAPPSVTFAAPGNCALIEVSAAPLDQPPASPTCDQPDIQTVTRSLSVGDQTVSIAGSAPAAGWDDFLTVLDRLAASVQA